MATTKKKIAEQIQRNYARFKDRDNVQGTNESIDTREIYLLIEQALNKLLKAQTFERFTDGYIDIPRCNIVSFTPVSVTADATNNRAFIDLTAIPLSLPMDMGVWNITPTGNPHNSFIPISSQDWSVMGVGYNSGTQSAGINTSYLEQQTGYYIEGKRIYFTKNITTSANGSVTQVTVLLLVSDLSQLSDSDLLPVSPEIESSVIEEVLNQISNGRISQLELNAKHENDNA
tara:strand:+ start:2337 stop:3029 length:693 start_codon:yes stop_codon:yes gene_type:complete